MLHPESTAYDLFDGNKYPIAELPTTISSEALASIVEVDQRLEKFSMEIGIEGDKDQTALTLENLGDRNCRMTMLDGKPIAVFWYGPTKTAVAFVPEIDGQPLTFYADGISPETAPFEDQPAAKRIWLNDLQGGPSACGCGHPLCRWTADYGPIKTATSLGHQAPAQMGRFTEGNRIRRFFELAKHGQGQ